MVNRFVSASFVFAVFMSSVAVRAQACEQDLQSCRQQGQEGCERECAQCHYREATRLGRKGDTDGALRALQAAYAHQARPALMYNIATTQLELNRRTDAYRSLELVVATANRGSREASRAERGLAELRRELGQLHVSVRPANAEVVLNAREIDVARVQVEEPSAYELAVSAPGHRPERRTVEFVDGALVEEIVVLERLRGELHVLAEPTSARVVLNGREVDPSNDLGAPGEYVLEEEPGEYELTVSAEGYRTATHMIEVVDGDRVERRVVLDREPLAPRLLEVPSEPFTPENPGRRWLRSSVFWAVVGVVVVGAAVGFGVGYGTQCRADDCDPVVVPQ